MMACNLQYVYWLPGPVSALLAVVMSAAEVTMEHAQYRESLQLDDPWPPWGYRHWGWEGETTQSSAPPSVEDSLQRGVSVKGILFDSPWGYRLQHILLGPVAIPRSRRTARPFP